MGGGSEFVLELDVGAVPQERLVKGQLSLKPSDDDYDWPELNCRVLVVDDRRDIRFLVRRLVEKFGGEVYEATNGQEGVEILIGDLDLGASIDVCVMDMQMPVMDGAEAVTRIRKAGVELPVIALTANAMKDDEDKCIAAGFTDYCSKPIVAKTLISKIAAACNRA